MLSTNKVLSEIINKTENLSNKVTLNDVIKTVDVSKNFIKDFKSNEMKNIMKVIKSLENRGILLKGTTTKSGRRIFMLSCTPDDSGLPLMKNVLNPLAKIVLIPLGLTAAAAAATETAIQKKYYGSGTAALLISNEEMKNIMKIVLIT